MVVLLTCKNEEDPIKSEGPSVLTRLHVVFFRRSRAANSAVSSGIMPKLLSSLAARIKIEGSGVLT